MSFDAEKLTGHISIEIFDKKGSEIIDIDGRDFEFVDGGDIDRDGNVSRFLHKIVMDTERGYRLTIEVSAYEDGTVEDADIVTDGEDFDILEDSLGVRRIRNRDQDY